MPTPTVQPHTVVDVRPASGSHHTLRVVPVLDTGLVLALPPLPLPAHVSWNGEEFLRRAEFHVILIGRHEVDALARAWVERTGHDEDSGREVVRTVLREAFPAAERLFQTIELQDDLLLVERGARRAIIQRCEVQGLTDFFSFLRQSLSARFPGGIAPVLELPDTHVTLYTPSDLDHHDAGPAGEERVVRVVLGEDGRMTSAA